MYKNVADLLKNWGPFGDLFLLSKVDVKKRNIFPFLRVLQNTEFLGRQNQQPLMACAMAYQQTGVTISVIREQLQQFCV